MSFHVFLTMSAKKHWQWMSESSVISAGELLFPQLHKSSLSLLEKDVAVYDKLWQGKLLILVVEIDGPRSHLLYQTWLLNHKSTTLLAHGCCRECSYPKENSKVQQPLTRNRVKAQCPPSRWIDQQISWFIEAGEESGTLSTLYMVGSCWPPLRTYS